MAKAEKGREFERIVCRALSRWISSEAAEDLFWRSSMSGGRATILHRKGKMNRQAGDIAALRPEGHVLTNVYFVECKFYRDLEFSSFIFGKGILAGFWKVACAEAAKHGRSPLLIAKENNRPPVAIFSHGSLIHNSPVNRVTLSGSWVNCNIVPFDTLVAFPIDRTLRL